MITAAEQKQKIRDAISYALDSNGLPNGLELRPHDSVGQVSANLLVHERRTNAPSRYYEIIVKEIR